MKIKTLFPGLLLATLFLFPVAVRAERTAPPVIAPITHEGVRYSVPNDNGVQAYVVATDAASGKQLWQKVIFRNPIKPDLEQDVQWVFIKQMRREGNTLIFTSERNKSYSLVLKTREVKELKEPDKPAEKK
jgi:hypothetical protein